MESLKNEKNIINVDKTINKTINIPQQLVGFSVYFIVFAVLLPTFFYKQGFYTFLEGYLPNLDLVANLLTWYSGNTGIWSDLYPSTALSLYGFLSQSFVNYLALLGVTFIIARGTKKSNNIINGWSKAFVMLLLTYLLPANFIRGGMDSAEKYFNNKDIALVSGIIITVSIILLESFIIRNSKKTLNKIATFVIDFPKNF